jgi:hypothetical protein
MVEQSSSHHHSRSQKENTWASWLSPFPPFMSSVILIFVNSVETFLQTHPTQSKLSSHIEKNSWVCLQADKVGNHNSWALWLQKPHWDMGATLGQLWLFLARIITANTLGAYKIQGLALKIAFNFSSQLGKSQCSRAYRVSLLWEKKSTGLFCFFCAFFLIQKAEDRS